MKREWTLGLIGCGAIADFHLMAIRELPGARLAMVSDRKPARAAEIGIREACGWTTDYRELLARPEIDIVCVTTASGSHAQIGMEVLEAGKHLAVEKPMAMTADDADRMNRLAAERGLTIAVISQRRFEPQHRIAHRLVAEGSLGKLLLIEAGCPFYRLQSYYDSAGWRGTVAHDGGAILNQGIHTLDLMLWFGGGVRTVYAKTATRTHRMEAEDIGTALMEFENGAFGTFTASTSLQPGFDPYLRLYGENGTIKLEGTRIVHWTVPGVPEPDLETDEGSGGGVSHPLSISNKYHREQLADLLASLSEGRKPFVTGQDGWQAVRVVQAMYRSAREGGEIRFNDGMK
ncbi:Gfo/Idh/MocA family protein [Cohnella zeiphila]|uniref:Gfo/Idh/MocA family oxidoreductase n=1 Tax=Cohnella zeiphila TaxID=2761120 RepID=A0A7X0VZU1_9BACL|nr:Gfo/Idh/MocA family oxidoreductase [Cohnella zeiphila]MBB6734318.1 Gfo/Idh/MocA family oxidoreductase [Cohnella zeiphila]